MSDTSIRIGAYPVPEHAEALAKGCGGDAEKLHLTLGYLNFDVDHVPDGLTAGGFARQLAWLAEQIPCWGEIHGRAVFYHRDPDQPDHRVLLVDAPLLTTAHQWLVRLHGGLLDDRLPWIPHLTVGTTRDGASGQYTHPTKILFERIVLHWGREIRPVSLLSPVENTPPL